MKKNPNKDPKAIKTVGVRLPKAVGSQAKKGMGNKGIAGR